MRVRAGHADGGEAPQLLRAEVVALLRRSAPGIAAWTRSIAAPLAQLAGRHAVDAHDLGVLARTPAGPSTPASSSARGVASAVWKSMNVQQRGVAAGRLLDQRAVRAGLGERVVVEPVAEHPLARRAARALRGDEPADLVQRRRRPGGRRRGRPSRPRNGCRWLSVRPGTTAAPCRSTTSVRGAGQLADLGVGADGDDHRRRRSRPPIAGRALRVERADAAAHQGEIGGAHALSSFVVGGGDGAAASSPGGGRSRAAAACTRAAGASSTCAVVPRSTTLPAVHDDRLVGDLAHDREVVADEHVGHAGAPADVGEQVEDLRLDRDVERGDGLVEDDHARLGRERARDRDPLALAAGQRARQRARPGARRARRGRPARATARGALGLRPPWCSRSTSSSACAAALARVEARVRVLEDDLHLAAAPPALARARAGRERSRPQAAIVPRGRRARGRRASWRSSSCPSPTRRRSPASRPPARRARRRRRRRARRTPCAGREPRATASGTRRLRRAPRRTARHARRAAPARAEQRTSPPSSGSSGGRAARQASCASAQRGANAQPAGASNADSGRPGIARQPVRASPRCRARAAASAAV